MLFTKFAVIVVRYNTLGETCDPLQLRINNDRLVFKQYKLSSTNDNNQVEYHYFPIHDFKSITLEILSIQKHTKELKFQYQSIQPFLILNINMVLIS